MIHTQENIVFVCLFIGFYGLVGIVRDVLKAAGLIDTRAIITAVTARKPTRLRVGGSAPVLFGFEHY
jgi:hypothetical protein